MSIVGINQRARSSEQKALRRKSVLATAEDYFLEVGYEAFSMAQLAQKAGVSKGTLYLYFATREELFLTLYEESLVRWRHQFMKHLSGPVTDRLFAESLYRTAMNDGVFVPLLTRLEHVIEHNVTLDRVIESKRVFIRQIDVLAEASAECLSLGLPQAREILKTLGVLLIGAARSDQGPYLDREQLPDDIAALVTSFSSEPLFVKNAMRIIEGVRADTSEDHATRANSHERSHATSSSRSGTT